MATIDFNPPIPSEEGVRLSSTHLDYNVHVMRCNEAETRLIGIRNPTYTKSQLDVVLQSVCRKRSQLQTIT